MKKIKSLMLVGILAITVSTSLTSCMTTKTNVGAYREKQGNEYTYAKGKQIWLFWGIMPVGRTSVNTPGDGDCQVITWFNFSDLLISGLTCGIVTTETIKVKAKKIRKPAHNSTYKKLAVQWINESLCFVSSSVLADSFVHRNLQLLIAAKR